MTGFRARYDQLKAERPATHPIWRYNAKLDARALVAQVGVRVPQLYATHGRVRDIPEPLHPVAIKPNNGCTALGVLLAVPHDDGWRDLFSEAVHPWAEWMRRLANVPRRPQPRNTEAVAGPWLVEELIGDQRVIPDDWKCYVIGGRVGIIAQMRRTPGAGRRAKPRLCQWTRDWQRVTATVDYVVDPTLPHPQHGAALVATAERIARELPAPFVRIDLYEDRRGPVFGEITPAPGGRHNFTPEWDARLGEMWGEP